MFNVREASARLASRASISLSAQLRESGSKAPITVVVKDISVGGMRVSTHVRLRPNQRVTLTVQLENGNSLELPARVIHTGEIGKEYRCTYGLRFSDLSEDVGRELSEYVCACLSLRRESIFRPVKAR